MFYLSYIRSELFRRKGRTILTVLGLAIGVALVIVVSSLSRGVDHAQKQALSPLSVDRHGPDRDTRASDRTRAAGPSGGGGGGGDVIQANSSVLTDLSKLGKPGAKVRPHLLAAGHSAHVPAEPGEADRRDRRGLRRLVGACALGGASDRHRAEDRREAEDRRAAPRRHRPRALQLQPGRAGEDPRLLPEGVPIAGDNARRSHGPGWWGRPARRRHGRRGGFLDSPAARKCLPAQVRNFRRTITTPQQLVQQVVDPPQTNIKSSTYSIAGVDPVAAGDRARHAVARQQGPLPQRAGNEALVADSYAASNRLKVGSTLDVNGTSFKVVGLVRPPLGGQTAEVYVPLAKLQALASKEERGERRARAGRLRHVCR